MRAGGGRMTPWDWLAPSTASRTRVRYTGRRGGVLVVEFELDALAAGDVLEGAVTLWSPSISDGTRSVVLREGTPWLTIL